MSAFGGIQASHFKGVRTVCDPNRTFGPMFLLFQFEFWRPRRWQRFVSFHDLDGKHFSGLALPPNFVHSAGGTEI
jgi:hypothetical protein